MLFCLSFFLFHLLSFSRSSANVKRTLHILRIGFPLIRLLVSVNVINNHANGKHDNGKANININSERACESACVSVSLFAFLSARSANAVTLTVVSRDNRFNGRTEFGLLLFGRRKKDEVDEEKKARRKTVISDWAGECVCVGLLGTIALQHWHPNGELRKILSF